MDNKSVAENLREVATLLERQGANPFRVNAYWQAARTVVGLREDLRTIVARAGVEGLVSLPGIGTSLASAIQEMLQTGRWIQLERLRGTTAPESLFQSVPGVGPTMARRIHDELHVDTLEALELAAHDGRLESVSGIGPRRVAMIRASLSEMLARLSQRRRLPAREPSVATLLAVDEEYRDKAVAGKLRKIAPRRFNPSGEAWLPVLHSEREGWAFSTLFSNTARAHELGRVFDWVVLYFHTDNEPEGQRTVVTETRGPLEGKRVVRGREGECRSYHDEALSNQESLVAAHGAKPERRP